MSSKNSVNAVERRKIDYIQQGRVKTTVSACCDADSLWVEVRRHSGKPWAMTPALARGFADLLRAAADNAEREGRGGCRMSPNRKQPVEEPGREARA